MTAAGLTRVPAHELVRLIAKGEASAAEAVAAHIARIEAVNPSLNAVVAQRFEQARAEAAAADARRARGEPLGSLHGLPVTIKDSIDVAGLPSTFGIGHRAAHRAGRDEVHVARLRAQGAIVLGKTNVSQCLIYVEADNPLYGRTNNPWNAARTCGGSSGGEGAIIAAGGSPLGLGTDIGGSVRYPATFCGIASLKPTSGRMDDLGECSVPLGQRAIPSQVGVLAREAADVALGYAVAAAGGPVPMGDPARVDIGALRVGWYADDGSFAPCPAVARAVQAAAGALRSGGAAVHEWTPPDAAESLRLLTGILLADGGLWLKQVIGSSPRAPQVKQLLLAAGLPPALLGTVAALLRALGQPRMAEGLGGFGPRTARRYWALVEAQQHYRERVARHLDQAPGGPFDVILAPVCALPAFTHGASRELLTAGAYTTLYNVLGWPAGVVPFTRVRQDEETARPPGSADLIDRLAAKVELGSAGLPIGVQVIARPWQEHVVLAVMQTLQDFARTSPDYPATPVTP